MSKLALIALCLLSGCATPQREVYRVEAFTLVVDSKAEIGKTTLALGAVYPREGYRYGNEIGVVWGYGTDKNGEPLPDFYTLGHEVWHLVKGDYHR